VATEAAMFLSVKIPKEKKKVRSWYGDQTMKAPLSSPTRGFL